MMNDPRVLRMATEGSVIGQATVGNDGTFLWVNKKFGEIIGYTSVEMVGRKFQDFTHPNDTDWDVEMTKRVISGEVEDYTGNKGYIHKRGHTVWAKLTVVAIRYDNGEFEMFFSQIIPNYLMEQAVVESSNKSAGKYIPIQMDWKEFVFDNWKFILIAGVLMASGPEIFKMILQSVLHSLSIGT